MLEICPFRQTFNMDVGTGVGNQLAHLVDGLVGASINFESFPVKRSWTNCSQNWSSAVSPSRLSLGDMREVIFEACE